MVEPFNSIFDISSSKSTIKFHTKNFPRRFGVASFPQTSATKRRNKTLRYVSFQAHSALQKSVFVTKAANFENQSKATTFYYTAHKADFVIGKEVTRHNTPVATKFNCTLLLFTTKRSLRKHADEWKKHRMQNQFFAYFSFKRFPQNHSCITRKRLTCASGIIFERVSTLTKTCKPSFILRQHRKMTKQTLRIAELRFA